MAVPDESAIASHPGIVAVPSRKATQPLTVPAQPSNVAANVNGLPTTDGLAELVRDTDGVTFSGGGGGALPTVKVYAAIAPTSGALAEDVCSGASWPSVA